MLAVVPLPGGRRRRSADEHRRPLHRPLALGGRVHRDDGLRETVTRFGVEVETDATVRLVLVSGWAVSITVLSDPTPTSTSSPSSASAGRWCATPSTARSSSGTAYRTSSMPRERTTSTPPSTSSPSTSPQLSAAHRLGSHLPTAGRVVEVVLASSASSATNGPVSLKRAATRQRALLVISMHRDLTSLRIPDPPSGHTVVGAFPTDRQESTRAPRHGGPALRQATLIHAGAMDYLLIALYFVFVLGIGFIARRQVSDSIDFFLSCAGCPPG